MRHVRRESVVLKKGGKGEAVRRRNPFDPRGFDEVCKCWYNADFARGCIGQVHVDLLQEVLDNNGVYESHENFLRYKEQGLVNQRCGYCYAFRNTGNVFPREVNEKTRASFEKYHPSVVRIGKLTEAGHPYYYTELMKFFNLGIEFGSSFIFPNKMFSFGIEGALETHPVVASLARKVGMESGERVAEELKRARVSLMYSIGYDCEEPGACLQGFTNEWRIRQAEKYHEHGVNVSLTIMCDVTQSFKANAAKGSAVLQVLDSWQRTGWIKNGINIRVLPLKPNSREVCGRLCCGEWGDIVQRNGTMVLDGMEKFYDFPVVDGVEQRPYRRRGNNDLLPTCLHPDFQELYNMGVGFCGPIGSEETGYEHCDKCNLTHERIRFPISELVPLDYSKKLNKPYKGRKHDKKDKQGRMF